MQNVKNVQAILVISIILIMSFIFMTILKNNTEVYKKKLEDENKKET